MSPLSADYQITEDPPEELPHLEELSGGVPRGQATDMVRHSNEKELLSLFSRPQNTLEVALKIISNRERYNLVQMLRCVVSPLRQVFDADQTRMKSKGGIFETVKRWGDDGVMAALLHKVLDRFEDGDDLLKMGVGNGQRDSGVEGGRHERCTANHLLCFSTALAGTRFVQCMHFSHAPPCFSLRLLSIDYETVQATLRRLSRLWRWLLDADRRGLFDADMAAFVASLQWPSWIWCREQFVLLAEYNFESAPRTAVTNLRHVLTGLFSTALSKDAMRVLRSLERLSDNHSMSAKAA